MFRLKISKYFFVLAAMFVCYGFALADNMADRKWSFEFRDCSLSEAVQEISSATKMNIKVNNISESQISYKRYSNESIENILTDLIESSSKAFLWYYRQNELVTVDVNLLESDSLYGAGNISTRSFQSSKSYSDNDSQQERVYSRPPDDRKPDKEEKERNH